MGSQRWSDIDDDDAETASCGKLGFDVTSLATSASEKGDAEVMSMTADSESFDGASSDGFGPEICTTLKIAGLPSSTSRSSLLHLLDSAGLFGEYDFVYLPCDLKRTGSCYGYAFANFVSGDSASAAMRCLEALSLDVAWADCQGVEAHVERFRNSPIMHHSVHDDAKPALFCEGSRVAFPAPTQRISHARARRTRM